MYKEQASIGISGRNIAICIQQNIASFVSNCLDSMRGTRNISVNISLWT